MFMKAGIHMPIKFWVLLAVLQSKSLFTLIPSIPHCLVFMPGSLLFHLSYALPYPAPVQLHAASAVLPLAINPGCYYDGACISGFRIPAHAMPRYQ